MAEVYLSLGSNLGDKKNYINSAISLLSQNNGIIISKRSSVFETEPVGNKRQPNFFNAALKITTSIQPSELLNVCKKIEEKLGRVKRPRWYEREIDLDILFYDNLILNTGDLIIPHPEIYYRRFVLEPLDQIALNFICPKTNKSIHTLLKECVDNSLVKKIE
jgi:2-amino-4-hydroxy-6-hydroxymethyldihydropteridine diphosphokinase